MEAKRIGGLYDDSKRHQAGSVWDKEQISPTIDTMQGGDREPMIIEDCLGGINYKVSDEFQKGYLPNMARSILANNDCAACIVAMRGRNPDNPSDRTAGAKTEQRLESNSQGICNTLTSVQKDNLVLEQQGITTKGKQQEVASTILAGYERSNMTGFNADNAVMETVRIKQATKDGYIDCEIGGVADLSFPNSDTRRGRVQGNGNISPTITAQETGICKIEKSERFFNQAIETLEENDCEPGDTINACNKVEIVGQISSEGSQCGTVVSENGIAPNLVAGTHGYANNHIQSQYRIRKLTPLECWRLMGFTDEDFHKAENVNSNSQLYKQAGNSIVKNVLMAIFGQMIEGKEEIYKDI